MIWLFLIVDDKNVFTFWRRRLHVAYCTTPHPFSVNSVVELLSQDTALNRNHKSTLFACFKALPVKRFIHALVRRPLFLSPYTLRARTKKPAPTLQHDFTVQLGSSTITPSASVRNLGVIFDDQLTFKEHIAKTARSCRFALHNIRNIRPFLTEHAAQLLVQVLVISRLDYCNALLAGLPSNTIKPLQMIQNAAARLVFNEPKRSHVTSLFISLHWLPVAARIQFKTLMLAYRTTTGSAPSYFHSLMTIYIPSRSLRSASEQRLVVPSQRGSKSLSRTFSFTVPGRWNDPPTHIRTAGSLSIFKQQLKTHLFQLYLTS